ncbi:MAG TPA: glycine cleavage system aminomethyltransferase GcvT, partial [Deltaproteobacteria bacterium]|nr:glycine cleavage system aminomethyltransferase GcvT [Deltaproteobacteria bacterium]
MKTPLFSEHERLGARIVDFHGWDMPVWYSGIRQEHLAVRRRAGVFDVSHMGEIIVQGKNAPSFLNRMTTRNVAAMGVGTVLYTFLLNEGGG